MKKYRVIDFHTHIFPDRVAPLAIQNLCERANAINYYDGTVDGLISDMAEKGIDLSICLPVITNPRHTISINNYAIDVNTRYKGKLISFGGIHPDYDDNLNEIDRLIDNGIIGIKLHPVYQACDIANEKYLSVMEYALRKGMYITIHAGLDPGFPGDKKSSVDRLYEMLKKLKERNVSTSRIILAHTGGLYEWEDVLEKIAGSDVYFDMSMTLGKMINRDGVVTDLSSNELFEKIVKKHGSNKILAGSDNPWTNSKDIIININKLNLSDDEKEDILFKNALGILSECGVLGE